MRAVLQRVLKARVLVEGEVVGAIGPGLLALVGVGQEDEVSDAHTIAEKAAHLRVFGDSTGRMELSALDCGASVLVVSQFTLYGDARKGRRPSYARAAGGEQALSLYEAVCERLRQLGLPVETGKFGAEMLVEMTGDGPVTLLLESRRQF